MKKIFTFLSVILFLAIGQISTATTLTGGISTSDKVPSGFFGTWKVVAVRTNTTNTEMFAPSSVEIWNLSKQNDVITLTNPISGASASITVKDATSDTFTFQRVTGDSAESVTETAKLILNGTNFTGSDTMVVRTRKKGMPERTENVRYTLKAYKVSGSDIRSIFSAW